MSDSQARYQEYLQSPYWKQVTDAVKRRADYRCQLCNSQHGLQAHHRSYQHRGRELEGNNLNDLVCLCAACHRLFHEGNKIAFQPPGIARAREERAMTSDLIEVTKQNHKGIRSHKQAWHWMMANGYNPKARGWRQRAIGHKIPAFCFYPPRA
jgi:hypothetical protein